jgi:autotransporter-associated beta strand protein
VVLTNATGIIRYKRGTLVLGVTNQFTGPLTIEGGVVKLGVPGAIPSGCQLVLANNDTSRADFNPAWQYTPAAFDSSGFDQQLGVLSLTGDNAGVTRMISLGNGPGTLSFADSSAESWNGFTLTVTNYVLGVSRLRFGTSAAGLTAAQLGQMQFADFLNLPGAIDASGYVIPNLPRLTQSPPSGGAAHLVWTAVNGRTYRVWSTDALPANTWSNLGDVYATDVTASYDDYTPNPNGRFYRVEVLP